MRPTVQQNGLFNDDRFKNSCSGNCTTDLFIQVIFLYLGDMVLGRLSEYGVLFVSRYHNLRSSRKNKRQVSPEKSLEKGVPTKNELSQYYSDDKLPVSEGANADYMVRTLDNMWELY